MKKTYKHKLPKNMEAKITNYYMKNGEIIINVELKKAFKPKCGDFLVNTVTDAIYILKDINYTTKSAVCYVGYQNLKFLNRWKFNTENYSFISQCRYATQKEKEEFLKKLELEHNKRWNAEKKCLEDIRWRPKNGELYYYIDEYLYISVARCNLNCDVDIRRLNANNCFKTPDEVALARNKIKEIFQNIE